MAGLSQFGLSGATGAFAGGALVIGAVIMGVVFLAPKQDQPELASGGSTAVEVAPTPQQRDESTATATPTQTETPTEPETPELRGAIFDVVRVEPDGSAVIAGGAMAGATVRLLLGDEEIGEAVADASGQFVAILDVPPSEQPRSLSALTVMPDGQEVPSDGAVLIAASKPAAPEPVEEAEQIAEVETEAPTAPEETETAEIEPPQPAPEASAQAPAAPEVGPEGQDDPGLQIASVASETPSAVSEPSLGQAVEADTDQVAGTEEIDTRPAAEVEAPVAPTVVVADSSGVRVVQGAERPNVPGDDAPETPNVVIDTITYDDTGDLALAGRGAQDRYIRIYLNDKAIQTSPIGEDGAWRTPLPDVDAGVYRLRIDEVDAEGIVTSRVETPLKRETPEVVAQIAQRPTAVTVQQGSTLWAIARDRLGSGVEYVRVFEANKGLIRDPDLIFPGQIFEIPEG